MKKLYFLLLLGVSFGMHSQNIYFPDPVLKQLLLTVDTNNPVARNIFNELIVIDANNNGEISVSEADQVSHLYLSDASAVTSLVGLHKFAFLRGLAIYGGTMPIVDISIIPWLKSIVISGDEIQTLNLGGLNLKSFVLYGTSITSLNFGNMPAMEQLHMVNVPITSLDISTMPLLQTVNINKTNITSIDFSGKQYLKQVLIDENSLTSINVQNCPLLYDLVVTDNLLTALDLSTNPDLKALRCDRNFLTALDLSSNSKLTTLYCGYNQLTTLNFSNNHLLSGFSCPHNPLEQLFIKNGRYYQSLDIGPITALKYICADENNIAAYKAKVSSNPLCEVNSYCSFAPGGVNYTINGNSKFDANNNGCDEADIQIKNLKFAVTNGTQSGNIIPDASGSYSFPVSAGTHTITPVLENPTYYNVSPANATVTFPTQTSPQTQNFCVTPNGTHHDLEVALTATNAARPGFDAHYRLVYKNKGNTAQSGAVSMTFNDALTDYVASSLTPTVTSNTLSWAFANLQPFETRFIDVTLNINSPMETPAVNDGDVLDFHAFVMGATDETPNDNEAVLLQTVVNSFDPNDKTCHEGTTITPEMVGRYVHYTIRFENTGTFAAQNIVVKDVLDAAKFDVASLIPLNASHNYTTRTNGNTVEFIFQNINLPFDDATNDGFVTFKIKTLPTLALGNTFSNTASIYFDYNFPIVTDPAVTTVAVLGVTDNEVSAFTVSPNPTSGLLHITAKNGAVVRSVAVYNVLGQVVLVVPNAKDLNGINVSALAQGNYIIKIQSDKGTSTAKFIKN